MPQVIPRKISKRNERFYKNGVQVKDKDGLGVGPIVIAFFLFVVVGSAILQIIRQNKKKIYVKN